MCEEINYAVGCPPGPAWGRTEQDQVASKCLCDYKDVQVFPACISHELEALGWKKHFSFVVQNFLHICYLFLPMCEVSPLCEKRTGTLSAIGSQKDSFSAGKGFCFMGHCLLSEVLGICWRPRRSLCSLSALFVLMLQTYVQACTHMVWAHTHNQHACLQMEEEKKKSFLVILANRKPISLAFNVGSRQSPLRQSKCFETDHAWQYSGLKSGWIIPDNTYLWAFCLYFPQHP